MFPAGDRGRVQRDRMLSQSLGGGPCRSAYRRSGAYECRDKHGYWIERSGRELVVVAIDRWARGRANVTRRLSGSSINLCFRLRHGQPMVAVDKKPLE